MNSPFVITVGAMRANGMVPSSDDLMATNTSQGPKQLDRIVKPDWVAPGNKIVSSDSPGDSVLYKASTVNRVNNNSFHPARLFARRRGPLSRYVSRGPLGPLHLFVIRCGRLGGRGRGRSSLSRGSSKPSVRILLRRPFH